MEDQNQTSGEFKLFLSKCKRVWQILKKPTMKEFETITKVSAAGIVLLGILGFAVSLVMQVFFK